MTSLEAAETEESISAILSLLGMGMKAVPKSVLKLQFGQASQIFLQILTKYASEKNFLILRHVRLTCKMFIHSFAIPIVMIIFFSALVVSQFC